MSQAKEITATYVRTKATMKKYIEAFEERKKPGKAVNPFEDAKARPEIILREFDHWLIIQNDFPYDAIADVNHMIFPKRSVSFDWKLLNEEERNEFQHLRETFLNEHYDAIYENLPKNQTQPGYFHLLLVKLKRTSLEEFMDQ